MSTPIKERSEFERFNGPLFVDSGGYKLLHNDGFDGADFNIDINQETALEMQRRMGADVIINLDQPIAPDDSYQERIAKARDTAQNIAEFLRLSQDYEAARYLSVHGYNYAMIDTFLDEVFDIIGPEIARRAFDGVALGGLIPKKDNKQALVTAVSDCRQVLEDRGFRDMPFHVLGISNSSIPLLTALGVDTFDSMAYLHAAINGKYHKSLLEDVSYDEANFEECGCPVCSDPVLVARMQGNAGYQKDILGPVAMHNLIIQKREVADIRNRIVEDGRDGLIEYFDETIARNNRTRKVAHRVVNEYLGGYF
jgi:tRNA-guanine family transglycosylase